ncbi:hypothetical protein P3S68_002859 [Capsicum galapagoense]
MVTSATTTRSDVNNEGLGISKAVLRAMCCSFPPLCPSYANELVSHLVEQHEMLVYMGVSNVVLLGGSSSGCNDGGGDAEKRAIGSLSSVVLLGGSSSGCNDGGGDAEKRAIGSLSNVVLVGGSSSGCQDGGGDAEKRAIGSFKEEPVDSVEKREMTLKLILSVLDKVSVDTNLLESVRFIVGQHLQSMVAFLKIRKCDWLEKGESLKVKINAMLAAYQTTARLQIKVLASLDLNGKSSVRLMHEALHFFIQAAEACLFSMWWKLRACEELFSSLLSGIFHAVVAHDSQMLGFLLKRIKPLVLETCAQEETLGNQGALFESVLKTIREIIKFGLDKDLSPIYCFIKSIIEWTHYEEEKEKQAAPSLQLNAIRLLADLEVSIKMPEAVDMILPFFIESLEFSDASVPGLLRRQLLDAVARTASLGFKKSYCEAVVLMTRSYLSKLSAVVSAETDTTASEATIERLETLPAGFLLIARDLTTTKLRTDYRHRLLSLCTHVGLAAVSKSGKSGADFLGPLLPAVAEICSDSDPTGVTKLVSTTLNSVGRTGAIGLQAVSGPYMWSADWFSTVQRISQGTPPLVVTSEKWLENEFELNALHNPGSWHGSGNEKAAISQRTALSAALGECIEVSAMNTFSAVKSTYLLAVMFLEVTRFSSNGGILSVDPSSTTSRSAFSCVFEYLKSPGLPLVVFQCLTAIVHRAFGTAVAWLEDRMSEIGMEAEYREFTLSTHARFLVQNLSQRDEHIRDISVNLLNQLRDRFPQEKLYKTNTGKKSQPTAQVVSLLSEIKIGIGKNDYWTGTRPANIPAVMAAAAAASGAKLKLTDSFTLEVLSTGMIGATVKCMHAGEIAGVRRLYYRIGSLDHPASGPGDMVEHLRPETESFTEVLLAKFVRMLQKFVNEAEKGGEVDKSSFRETCSQATALLLSDMASDPKSNADSFSQLLSLLCWCPAYILTPDAMDTGVFIWTWLVSAAPQLCSLVLAELVDAWLWTVDTKRGLFASQIRCCGPVAMLKPHLVPGEPEAPPEKDPVEQIMAHRLWLGFFIDRFEVVQHDSFPQLLLLGRLLQQTTEQHWNFSSHPAATGTFFTFMLLGLKFCSCKSLGNLQNLRAGLQLLEDRIYRASFWWFAHQPEWYDLNKNFALSEAQSVSMFVYHLLNEQLDTPQLDPSLTNERLSALENRSSLNDVKDQYHPVWGKMGSYAVGREKRKQLLLMLCQHEADRLDVWAKPTARFPTNNHLKAEVEQLVQLHILEMRHIPEALPYLVTPKAIDENSTHLQQFPHWAACSITQALEFLTPAYKGHPCVMAYVLRVLESYPPQTVTFFMPQLVQALRYDDDKLVEEYLLRAAQRSDIFAHILIWNLQSETCELESGKHSSAKNIAFLAQLPLVRQRIIDSFNAKARDLFQREFDFFDKVTSISGALYPLTKEERRAGIRRELEKIEMQGDDLYLPTASNKILKGIQVDSGIPLQSAAKVPIMITFNVADRDGDRNDIKPQACIFKVGDDCRQDVLALQVISLLKDIFEAVRLHLYLYPYGVLPTGPERGIIEIVNSPLRDLNMECPGHRIYRKN